MPQVPQKVRIVTGSAPTGWRDEVPHPNRWRIDSADSAELADIAIAREARPAVTLRDAILDEREKRIALADSLEHRRLFPGKFRIHRAPLAGGRAIGSSELSA